MSESTGPSEIESVDTSTGRPDPLTTSQRDTRSCDSRDDFDRYVANRDLAKAIAALLWEHVRRNP